MTKDEIIEMARQAASHGVENHRSGEVSYVFYNEHLTNFAKLVAQHEREACAKVCDDLWQEDGTAYQCREAIKARGKL
jgi:ribosomal protein L10